MPATRFATAPDGTRLAYDLRGSGPALLLHGLLGRRGRWEEMGYVGPLAERFTVVSLDLRSNGAGDAPSEPSAYALERIVGDVLAVADATGAEQFALWGFSWGASAMLQVAARSPRVRRSVTLGGFFCDVYDAERVLPIVQDWRELAEAMEQNRLEKLVNDPEERAFLATTHPRGVATCWERLLTWPDLAPADVTCPLLLCAGTSDARVTLPLHERKDEIKAAGHDVVFFEGLDHRATFERSDLTLPAGLAFLA